MLATRPKQAVVLKNNLKHNFYPKTTLTSLKIQMANQQQQRMYIRKQKSSTNLHSDEVEETTINDKLQWNPYHSLRRTLLSTVITKS